jgi:hypothetical protein
MSKGPKKDFDQIHARKNIGRKKSISMAKLIFDHFCPKTYGQEN